MKVLLLVFMFLVLKLGAQSVTIAGKVNNDNSKPIENATIYLLKQKDSSIINYTASNVSGSFSLKVNKQSEPSILKISTDGFQEFSKSFNTIDDNISLSSINLNKNLTIDIDEVLITTAPIKVKKDTIEYNASYLKVKPDSKIDELLTQIPGVETDDSGSITVNGKPVNKILINGKAFFDNNGKIALQSFPADIIKKIQVTTSKTKEEEYTGRSPQGDSLTVNFNIDERKNKGTLNNISLGYGSNKRYEGQLFLTRFKNNSNIALIAASNNINVTGFSVDSFFDKGGKNSNTNGKAVNSGIMKTSMVGINYSDKIGNDVDLDKLSANFNDNNLETFSKTSRTTFLPDYKLDRNNERSGSSNTKKLDASADGTIRIDALTRLIISTDFSNTSGDNFSNSSTTTLRDDNLLNSNTNYTRGDSQQNKFSPKISLAKKFNKPKRSLSASINNVFSAGESLNYSNIETIFYQNPGDNNYRNQSSNTKNSRSVFGADFKYFEPISDSATVSIEVNYDYQKLNNDRIVNDYNVDTHQYSDFNALLSNKLYQSNNFLKTALSYNLDKSKLSFRATASLKNSNLGVNSVQNSDDIQFAKQFTLPEYNLKFTYRFDLSKTLEVTNQAGFSLPSVNELNPYIDTSNPLVTEQGNQNLKSTWQNNSKINYRITNVEKNTNFFFNLNFNYINNDIVDYSYYDDSGKQFSSFANISGNKRFNFNSSFSKIYKWQKNKLTLTPSFSASYNYRKGFVDGTLFNNEIYTFSPKFRFLLNLKDKLDLRSTLGINFSYSDFNNYNVGNTQIAKQNFTLGMTNYFFDKNLYFDNDFTYSGNSNLTADFNRKSYFWNSSVAYQFYKKQMILKFRVNDLLNQGQNATRTIGDNYVEDREDLVLRRYFMLSLTLKFNSIGK